MLALRKCCFALLLLGSQLILQCLSLLPHDYCDVGYYCSYEEALVWAKDGDRCYVFRNACLMKKEECERHKLDSNSKLRVVDEASCRKHCLLNCEDTDGQVCATFHDGEFIKFESECDLLNYACMESKPYNLDVSLNCSFGLTLAVPAELDD